MYSKYAPVLGLFLVVCLSGCSLVSNILGGGSGQPNTADSDDFESDGWQTSNTACPLKSNTLYGNYLGVTYVASEDNFQVLCDNNIILKEDKQAGRCRNFKIWVETEEGVVSEHSFTAAETTYPDVKTVHFGEQGRTTGKSPPSVTITGFRCSK